MVDFSDLSIEDQREIEQFKIWLAKIDVLEKSGKDKNEAMIEAYQEVYYPATLETSEPGPSPYCVDCQYSSTPCSDCKP